MLTCIYEKNVIIVTFLEVVIQLFENSGTTVDSKT